MSFPPKWAEHTILIMLKFQRTLSNWNGRCWFESSQFVWMDDKTWCVRGLSYLLFKQSILLQSNVGCFQVCRIYSYWTQSTYLVMCVLLLNRFHSCVALSVCVWVRERFFTRITLIYTVFSNHVSSLNNCVQFHLAKPSIVYIFR